MVNDNGVFLDFLFAVQNVEQSVRFLDNKFVFTKGKNGKREKMTENVGFKKGFI